MPASAAGPRRVYWLIDWVARGVSGVGHCPGHHGRTYHPIPMLCCNGLERVLNLLSPELSSMVDHHQKRVCRLDHELVHAPGHPAHGVGPEWPLGGKAVFLPDFLPCVKNGGTGQAPVYDLRRTPPGQFLPGQYLRAVRWRVGRLRPYNGPPVTAGNQEKSLSGCRRPIVSRHQLPPFHRIAQALQLVNKAPECLPGLCLYRVPTADRPPGLELLHILQDDHAGPDCPSPPQDDPGQPPDVLVHGLPALGLAEMLAVRGGPQ